MNSNEDFGYGVDFDENQDESEAKELFETDEHKSVNEIETLIFSKCKTIKCKEVETIQDNTNKISSFIVKSGNINEKLFNSAVQKARQQKKRKSKNKH